MLLAGVLLKMGTYGFLRFCLPLTPDACITVGVPLIGTLAVIGILYGAFCALAQRDIKKLGRLLERQPSGDFACLACSP